MFTHTSCRNLPQKFTAEQTTMAVLIGEDRKFSEKKNPTFMQLVQEEKVLLFHAVITN